MKLKLLIAVLGLQCAFLLGITAVEEHALTTGKIILLETERVDPRDMLRGDYLVLNYKISAVPRGVFSPRLTGTPAAGAKVFVAVAQQGADRFYTITRASTVEFEPMANEIILLGQASENWRDTSFTIHVDYGIERFYVAEGTGIGRPSGKLTVRVSVPSSDRPIIKQVFVDGRPYADDESLQRPTLTQPLQRVGRNKNIYALNLELSGLN